MRTTHKNVDLLFRSSLFYAVALRGLLKIPAVFVITFKLFSLVQFTPYKINPEQNIVI